MAGRAKRQVEGFSLNANVCNGVLEQSMNQTGRYSGATDIDRKGLLVLAEIDRVGILERLFFSDLFEATTNFLLASGIVSATGLEFRHQVLDLDFSRRFTVLVGAIEVLRDDDRIIRTRFFDIVFVVDIIFLLNSFVHNRSTPSAKVRKARQSRVNSYRLRSLFIGIPPIPGRRKQAIGTF